MSDRLALANAIEDAGIDRAKAERVASVIVDIIHDQVATKADVATVSADLRRTEIALRADLDRLEHRLTMRGLAALTTGLGLLFAALHYWPPHG